MSQKITQEIHIEEFFPDQLSTKDKHLVDTARKFCDNAYAPYSKFFVGAAILLANGEIVCGSNQENAAYPSGLCAERVAIFSASAQYPGVRIEKVAIAAKSHGSFTGASPCGSCRQVISEYQDLFNQPIEIFFPKNNTEIIKAASIDMLLPFKFSKENL